MTLREIWVDGTRASPAGDRTIVRQRSRPAGPTVIAWTALAFAALFQFFQLVPGPGGVDLSGYATAIAAAAAVIAIPPTLASRRRRLSLEGRQRQEIPTLTLLVWCLFLAWAAATVAMNRLDSRAVQHLSVYLLFVAGLSIAIWTTSHGAAEWYLGALARLGVLLSLVFLAAKLIGGEASRVVYGPRSFALTALICLAAAVAYPHATARHSLRRWTPYLIAVVIAASLSRTAAAVALLFLVVYFARARPGKGNLLRTTVALCILSALTVGAIHYVPAVHDRVFGGDRATVSGFRLNTEGRTVLWRVVENQISTDPWLGHGTGAASDAIARAVPSLTQPHNDYLRLLDDNGIIGLSIWCLGFALLFAGCLKRLRRAEGPESAVHLAALLSLLAVAISMTTDNTIVYPFVMLPVAVLVGASLAQPLGPSRKIVDEPGTDMSTPLNKSGR